MAIGDRIAQQKRIPPKPPPIVTSTPQAVAGRIAKKITPPPAYKPQAAMPEPRRMGSRALEEHIPPTPLQRRQRQAYEAPPRATTSRQRAAYTRGTPEEDQLRQGLGQILSAESISRDPALQGTISTGLRDIEQRRQAEQAPFKTKGGQEITGETAATYRRSQQGPGLAGAVAAAAQTLAPLARTVAGRAYRGGINAVTGPINPVLQAAGLPTAGEIASPSRTVGAARTHIPYSEQAQEKFGEFNRLPYELAADWELYPGSGIRPFRNVAEPLAGASGFAGEAAVPTEVWEAVLIAAPAARARTAKGLIAALTVGDANAFKAVAGALNDPRVAETLLKNADQVESALGRTITEESLGKGQTRLVTNAGDRLDWTRTAEGGHIDNVTAVTERQGAGTALLNRAIDDIRRTNPDAVITGSLNSESGARLFARQAGATFTDFAGNPVTKDEAIGLAQRFKGPLVTLPPGAKPMPIETRRLQEIKEGMLETIEQMQAQTGQAAGIVGEGQADLALRSAGAAAGGAAGVTQGDTPQERARNALLGAGLGSRAVGRGSIGGLLREQGGLARGSLRAFAQEAGERAPTPQNPRQQVQAFGNLLRTKAVADIKPGSKVKLPVGGRTGVIKMIDNQGNAVVESFQKGKPPLTAIHPIGELQKMSERAAPKLGMDWSRMTPTQQMNAWEMMPPEHQELVVSLQQIVPPPEERAALLAAGRKGQFARRDQAIADALAAGKSKREALAAGQAAMAGRILPLQTLVDVFSPQRIDTYFDNIHDAEASGVISKGESLAAKAGMELLTEGARASGEAGAIQPAEIKALARVFGPAITPALPTDATKLTKMQIALAPIQVLRSWKTAFDDSFGGGQGWKLIGQHPEAWWKGKVAGWKAALGDEATAERMMEYLRETSPTYVRGQEAERPLGIMTSGGGANPAEEFMSPVTSKIPLLNRSERAFVVGGSYMRQLALDAKVGMWEKMNPGQVVPDDVFQDMIDLVNAGTNWGDVSRLGPEWAKVASMTLFSARAKAALFQYPAKLAQTIGTSSDPALRKIAVRDLVAWVGQNLAVLAAANGIGQLTGKGGADVNPWSPTFGQIKFGPAKIDIWQGYSPIARLILQEAHGKREIDGTPLPINRMELPWNYIRGQVSPLAQIAIDSPFGPGKGRSVEGDKFNSLDYWRKVITPLGVGDSVDAFRELGPLGAGVAFLSTEGIRTNTYETSASTQQKADRAKYLAPIKELEQKGWESPYWRQQFQAISPTGVNPKDYDSYDKWHEAALDQITKNLVKQQGWPESVARTRAADGYNGQGGLNNYPAVGDWVAGLNSAEFAHWQSHPEDFVAAVDSGAISYKALSKDEKALYDQAVQGVR